MLRRHFISTLAAASVVPGISFAQGKPIRLVVPFPPGGATDITARVLGEPVAKILQQPVVIDNRAGAGGSIGMAELARATPDGLTFGIATTPLVLDSPHSGTAYPADFGHACDSPLLRQAEDTHVEKLYDFAPRWASPGSRRCSRAATSTPTAATRDRRRHARGRPGRAVETDPAALSKVRLGKGLVWKNLTDDGQPIYQRKLRPQEVRRRIERCWQPYHAAVARPSTQAHARHGYSLHLNCHSMPAIAGRIRDRLSRPGACRLRDRRPRRQHRRPRAVAAGAFLRGFGYSVEIQPPYKGVELVRRYGDPAGTTATASRSRSTASCTWTRPRWRCSAHPRPAAAHGGRRVARRSPRRRSRAADGPHARQRPRACP
jgi:N-formylglutamate deformylase